MQDQWENEITVVDDGTSRSYTRMVDGTTVEYPSSNPQADLFAINCFNGMQPA